MASSVAHTLYFDVVKILQNAWFKICFIVKSMCHCNVIVNCALIFVWNLRSKLLPECFNQ